MNEYGVLVVWMWRGTEQNLPESVTLSNTNPMQTGLGSNLGPHGERTVTDCMSHSTATMIMNSQKVSGKKKNIIWCKQSHKQSSD
jgi:hypothetical protein